MIYCENKIGRVLIDDEFNDIYDVAVDEIITN